MWILCGNSTKEGKVLDTRGMAYSAIRGRKNIYAFLSKSQSLRIALSAVIN